MFFRSLFFFLFILFFSPLLLTLSGCSCSSEVVTEDKEPEDYSMVEEYYSFDNKIPHGTAITLSPTKAFSNYIYFSNLNVGFYLQPLSTPSSSAELPNINTNNGLITLSNTTSAGVYSIHITNTTTHTTNTTNENIFDIYLYITQSPSTKSDLLNLIQEGTDNWGDTANLNYLETSAITDMSSLFTSSLFNGDISDWDVSSVTTMENMFKGSLFDGDISDWDVSSVMNMSFFMFVNSVFNGDISDWDVSSVTTMEYMFLNSVFNRDISDWDVSSVTSMEGMFADNSVFNIDLEEWKEHWVLDSNGKYTGNKDDMFLGSEGVTTPPSWY